MMLINREQLRFILLLPLLMQLISLIFGMPNNKFVLIFIAHVRLTVDRFY